MKRRRIHIFLLAMALFIGSSVGVIVAYAYVETSGSVKINQKGDTYGLFVPAATPDKQTVPKLIAAIGIDGTVGYVYESDLQEDMPRTPEEAVAYMQKLEAAKKEATAKGNKFLRYIPLYDETGTRVIGQFGVGPIGSSKDNIVE